jgi:hypothetical protein
MRHNIDFSSTAVLDKAPGYTDHLIKEIRLHPRNFNRDRSFSLGAGTQ